MPKDEEQTKELFVKLAEYKPLAKIEEMEEQNYNIVDNVLNNGAGDKSVFLCFFPARYSKLLDTNVVICSLQNLHK